MPENLTGGCQCGAVRYRLNAEPSPAVVCFCRMCQKQMGNVFAIFAGIDLEHFEVTRGEIAWFRSSDTAKRGFCRDCGTPLTYGYVGKPRISFTIGSLDNPEAMEPQSCYGIEGRISWIERAVAREGAETGHAGEGATYNASAGENYQHPDHDTAEWEVHRD